MAVLVVLDVMVVGDHAHDLVKLHLPVVHYFSTFTERREHSRGNLSIKCTNIENVSIEMSLLFWIFTYLFSECIIGVLLTSTRRWISIALPSQLISAAPPSVPRFLDTRPSDWRY